MATVPAGQRLQPRNPSAVPYALWASVLVVMGQSALASMKGGRFRGTYVGWLLSLQAEPLFIVGTGMVIVSVASYFIIRPYCSQMKTRWAAFLGCVVGFTILADALTPELA